MAGWNTPTYCSEKTGEILNSLSLRGAKRQSNLPAVENLNLNRKVNLNED
jgi:hypothetical protein